MTQQGQKIRHLRQQKGLSQVQLAGMIGVNNSLISKLESGETQGSIHTLRKIATALNANVSDLLEEQAS